MMRIAQRDLKAARALLDPGIDEASWGFQIQQAVEKSLKAWLLHLGDDPPLIHNIKALLQRLEAAGACVADFRNLEPFTSFAVQFRYDADPEPMGLDRADWLHRAEGLIDHVELIIGVKV
ncbi:MAG: HEPN domain-containing protein [Cyanobium sp.]